MKSGPIIIIDDDKEDHEMLQDVLRDLEVTNPLIWFVNTDEAWDHLVTTTAQPFVIFCDVNLPKQNGIEFKKQVDTHEDLRKKSIHSFSTLLR